MYLHVVPLSVEGKTANVVRRTMKFGSLGANTSWLAAGKRPFAQEGAAMDKTTDAALAARMDLRTGCSLARSTGTGTKPPHLARASGYSPAVEIGPVSTASKSLPCTLARSVTSASMSGDQASSLSPLMY